MPLAIDSPGASGLSRIAHFGRFGSNLNTLQALSSPAKPFPPSKAAVYGHTNYPSFPNAGPLAQGVRLSAITGAELPDDETQIIYHYAVDGGVLNVKVPTHGNEIESITPVMREAAWAEREIHDLYGTVFVEHPDLTRLVRPSQLANGFFRENGHKEA